MFVFLTDMSKKISSILKRFAVKHLVFLNVLVFQNADTLKFVKGDSIIEQWVMSEDCTTTDLGTLIYTTKSMVSDDNRHFLFCEEKYYPAPDSHYTKLTFYDAYKKKIWVRSSDSGRRISFYLSAIYDNIVAIVTTDKHNTRPSLHLVKDKKMTTIINDDEWYKLAKYSFSANMQYLALHVKNPYKNKIWDYIHFMDMQNKKEWTYLFPTCVSCKRQTIDVAVDDEGTTEVIYKGEHRVFSRQGKLIDIYRLHRKS